MCWFRIFTDSSQFFFLAQLYVSVRYLLLAIHSATLKISSVFGSKKNNNNKKVNGVKDTTCVQYIKRKRGIMNAHKSLIWEKQTNTIGKKKKSQQQSRNILDSFFVCEFLFSLLFFYRRWLSYEIRACCFVRVHVLIQNEHCHWPTFIPSLLQINCYYNNYLEHFQES